MEAVPAESQLALSPLTDPAFQRVPGRDGRIVVCWRTASGELPRNADFALEVWIFAGERPIPDAELSVNARMPEHGHGMLRATRSVNQGDGSYRVEGMLFHMRGHWELVFDVVHANSADVAQCSLEVR